MNIKQSLEKLRSDFSRLYEESDYFQSYSTDYSSLITNDLVMFMFFFDEEYLSVYKFMLLVETIIDITNKLGLARYNFYLNLDGLKTLKIELKYE